MNIMTKDQNRIINVGTGDIWYSLYSTIVVRLEPIKDSIKLAIVFFETAECKAEDAEETARQINLVRDRLSDFPPDKAVYDWKHLEKEVPWAGKISRNITSCANLYTTAEGEDLLCELVRILCYASRVNTSVYAG